MPFLKDRKQFDTIVLKNEPGLAFELLENGSIFSLQHGDILINQVLTPPVEGAMSGVYLRLRQGKKLVSAPLTGPRSDSAFSVRAHSALWTGRVLGLDYRCELALDAQELFWTWRVTVKNTGRRLVRYDLVLGQDIALSHIFGARLNEAYTCQYLDHTVLKHPQAGPCIALRQNQAQGQNFPWMLVGCAQGAAGYLTDGYQFFGTSYLETDRAAALDAPAFPNRRLQYEFAYPALVTKTVSLRPGKSGSSTFFALYEPNHPEATGPKDAGKITQALAWCAARHADEAPASAYTQVKTSRTLFGRPLMFESLPLTAREITRYFGKKLRHVEKKKGQTWSFFTEDARHVVLKAKALVCERPHGQILRSGVDIKPSDDILSTTSYMHGVFHAQVTVGNTSFHKLLPVMRNPLNVLKSGGQRLFVKTQRGLELLGLPSAYEIGLNHARWIYRGRKETLVVTAWVSPQNPAAFLEVVVEKGGPKRFIVSHQIVAGNNEFDSRPEVTIDPERRWAKIKPAAAEMAAQRYPETTFYLVCPEAKNWSNLGLDGALFADGQDRGYPYVTAETKPVRRFSLCLTGNVLSAEKAGRLAQTFAQGIEPLTQAQEVFTRTWAQLRNQARVSTARKNEAAAKIDDLLFWYAHNVMVHYLVPHGLEQYSGAAWGLRDVCQGPIEFMLATRNYPVMKDILRTVFRHQYRESGDWPQWFMFDRYQNIQAPESHGDIIVWPLKALCDYLEATQDLDFLNEPLAYTAGAQQEYAFTAEKETVAEHMERLLSRIEKICLTGTFLVSYGHGDWEDTLQPAKAEMREHLVSSWTVELAYQTIRRYAAVCERAGRPERAKALRHFCDSIREDFNRHLVKDGVVAGLAHFTPAGVEYLLHPRDEKTGLRYRLLPMTRGMISELFTPAQAKRHLAIIRRALLFPDGVRLNDRPIPYRGGLEKYFKRAETAANFGREIGLQYVHSHIRYIEAMAKLGLAEDAYAALQSINPINLAKAVPNALPRQANAYFSSSDGDFADRYEARAHFAKLKQGTVGVKGGWRIYSSGPGILVQQIISNLFGLRVWFDQVVLDPVISKALDGICLDFPFEGRPVRYVYHVARPNGVLREVAVNGQRLEITRREDNPYRPGGAMIPRTEFLRCLKPDHNQVDLYIR